LNTTPLFTGKLLRFAAHTPDDAAILSGWSHNDAYLRLVDDDPARPLSPDALASSDSTNNLFDSVSFRLRTLEGDRLVGLVALFGIKWTHGSALMAILIGEPDDWGKGYGTDGLGLLLAYAFRELNLYRVGLTVMSYNTRAIRLYEKAGFTLEGRIRGAICRDRQRFDMLQYGVLAEEWFARTEDIT
jgi:RimJ/RimL family protein N-acetyltransferase